MTEKILSFIIPSFNSQAYLKKCLNSFLVEEVFENIEVLVVNDGSTDSTQEIAQDYERKYPGVFFLINKENGGHGSAINAGIKAVSGKYVKVIDADDCIMTENLISIVRALEKSNAQVILAPFYTIDIVTGERAFYSVFCKQCYEEFSMEDIIKQWRVFEHGLTFHGIIYETQFYNNNGMELVEKVFYEDHEYATIPCCHAEKIGIVNISLYEYAIGNSDQSVALHNQMRRVLHVQCVISHMIEYYCKVDLNKTQKLFFYRKVEVLILVYYKIRCFIQPDRGAGRKECAEFNEWMYSRVPEWKISLNKKYKVFNLASKMGLTYSGFEMIQKNSVYKRLRGKK